MALSFTQPEMLREQREASSQALALWERRHQATHAAALCNFLRHVAGTVPYYRELLCYDRIEPSAAFERLPLISKQDILKRYEDFRSSAFQGDQLQWQMTSGTTGMPLRIPRDLASIYGVFHDTYVQVFSRIPGLTAKLRPARTAIILLDDVPRRHPCATVGQPALMGALLHRVILGESRNSDAELVRNLRSEEIPLIYGRPRSLRHLLEADEEESGGRIRAHALLSSGDNLYESDRKAIERWFEAPLFNAYGSQEGGVVGMECEYRRGIHLFQDRTVLEVRGDSGKLVSTGSGEFVLSNLINWAMPFLRYRTADFGVLEMISCKCGYEGQTISTVNGRDSTYFLFGEIRRNPSEFDSLFERPEIRQYRVIQEVDRSFTVEIVTAREESAQSVLDDVKARFAAQVSGSTTDIRKVASIGLPGEKVQRYHRVDMTDDT